jgi:hypothetical protein
MACKGFHDRRGVKRLCASSLVLGTGEPAHARCGGYVRRNNTNYARVASPNVRAGDKGSHFGRFGPEPVVHAGEPGSAEAQ